MRGKEGGFALREGRGRIKRDMEHRGAHCVVFLWIEGCWRIEGGKRRVSDDFRALE